MAPAPQVPEINASLAPKLAPEALLQKVQRAQKQLGAAAAVPMLIGPVTMARLAKLDGIDVAGVVQKLLPLYQELLQKLKALKVRPSPLLRVCMVFAAPRGSRSSNCMCMLNRATLGVQVPEVQILEPALCMHDSGDDRATYEKAYAALAGTVPLNLVTFYDDLGAAYAWAVALPVQAVSIDFCGVVRIPTTCILEGAQAACSACVSSTRCP